MAATIQEYNDDIEASEKDIKAGRFIPKTKWIN